MMYSQIVIKNLELDETGRSVTLEDYHAARLVDETFEMLWSECHRRFELVSGDIAPEQQAMEDDLRDKLTRLVASFVTQNRGGDHAPND
jgi:hypothetical protein